MKVSFKLKGTEPLLMHADDIDAADALTAWRNDPDNKDKSKKGDDRSPGWTWLAYVYHDGTNFVWPADNLMVCLREAAAEVILKGSKTYKQVSQSGIQQASQHLDLLVNGQPVPLEPFATLKRRDAAYADYQKLAEKYGFKVWAKRARVGQSKHIRTRARFEHWAIHGVLTVTNDILTEAVVKRVFEIAGTKGLGDWRPSSKTPGIYGQFEAELKFSK